MNVMIIWNKKTLNLHIAVFKNKHGNLYPSYLVYGNEFSDPLPWLIAQLFKYLHTLIHYACLWFKLLLSSYKPGFNLLVCYEYHNLALSHK